MKLLFCSDLHVRSDNPGCRVDDFQETQKLVLEQIRDIAIEEKATIIMAGDIFHRAKPLNPQYLEILLYETFKECTIYFLAGQHDLINHSVDNFDRGSIGVLSRYKNWYQTRFLSEGSFIEFFNWNRKISKPIEKDKLKICVVHKFVSDTPLPPWMKKVGIEAKDLCKGYDYDIFVCGDNHKSFVYENKKTNQIVFNCGTITRQKISEKDYIPNIFVYDTRNNKYKKYELLDNKDVVTNVPTNKLQLEREQRISSFVELVDNKDSSLEFDFESDLQNRCKKNNVEKSILNEINEIIMEAKSED